MPIAEAHYGDTEFWIESAVSGTVVYHGFYIKATGRYNIEFNNLNDVEAGWYIMSVSVAKVDGKYTGLSEDGLRIQVFIRGTDETVNSWIEFPYIEGWTANIGEDGNPVYNMPTGEPVRGKMYFEFFEVIDGVQEQEPIGPGKDAKTIEPVGLYEEIYSRTFHIPTKPGEYRMYAYAENGVDKDFLAYPAVTFTIRYRQNTWIQSVQIDPLLELGDYYKNPAKWGKHTAEAAIEGSTVEFEFYTADGEKLGSTVPTTPGQYIIRAIAKARYCKDLISEMEFEVALSKNYWVNDTSPSIENWSEENNDTSPDPVGEAAFGEIVYTYINNDTGEILYHKPLKAGHYTMIARVELDGYEVLQARYDFVVEPAFNMTLVVICIILATIASALSVVVITYAVKRNREN